MQTCISCRGFWVNGRDLPPLLGNPTGAVALIKEGKVETAALPCPRCAATMQALSFPTGRRRITIDCCQACEGFWFDPDELNPIRQWFTRAGGPALPPRNRVLSPASPRPFRAIDHYRSASPETNTEFAEMGVLEYLFCFISRLPTEVYNPRFHFPDMVITLIAINVLVYCFEATLNPANARWFIQTMGMIPSVVERGEGLMSLFTSQFVHGSWPHLVGNMWALWTFGDNVYDVFCDHGRVRGPVLFLVFFLLTGLLGGLAHMFHVLYTPIAALPLVGASGAISGVMAAYWRLFPRTAVYQIIFLYPVKVPIAWYFLFWIGWNFLLSAQGFASGIAWTAHLASFLAGLLLLPLFLPYSLAEFQAPAPRERGSR